MRRVLLVALVAVPAATAKHKPKGFTPATLAGTWSGTWNNQTSNTTGTLALTIAAKGTALNFTAAITGNTFKGRTLRARPGSRGRSTACSPRSSSTPRRTSRCRAAARRRRSSAWRRSKVAGLARYLSGALRSGLCLFLSLAIAALLHRELASAFRHRLRSFRCHVAPSASVPAAPVAGRVDLSSAARAGRRRAEQAQTSFAMRAEALARESLAHSRDGHPSTVHPPARSRPKTGLENLCHTVFCSPCAVAVEATARSSSTAVPLARGWRRWRNQSSCHEQVSRRR